VISLFYYVGVIQAMWQMAPPEGARAIPETSLSRVVLAVAVVATIVIGTFPQPFIRLVNAASVIGRF
jgi:NADH:ubiquinone oxidoreductase subunit 2 (subunit N)